MKIIILIPVYNDWQSLFKLLENINSEIYGLNKEFSIIVVNDASTENKSQFSNNLNNIKSIKIINMRENKGHARCNAAGLKYILENENFDYVIPMDGDGEDRPEEIKQFINNLNYHPDKPIVGERIKRSESVFFKLCYFFHKQITFAFTGKTIKYGNYTCLPKSIVEKMVNEKATWSSFSGSLAKVANEKATVPSERGTRYFGPSKMNFINLIIHSLSIISVFKFVAVLRSALFVIVYFFLIHQNFSTTMLIPIIFIIVMIISIFIISKRENNEQFENSLKNILDIEELKK